MTEKLEYEYNLNDKVYFFEMIGQKVDEIVIRKGIVSSIEMTNDGYLRYGIIGKKYDGSIGAVAGLKPNMGKDIEEISKKFETYKEVRLRQEAEHEELCGGKVFNPKETIEWIKEEGE